MIARLSLALILASLLVGRASAQGGDIILVPFEPSDAVSTWKAELDTTNDWFDVDLWVDGLPTAERAAWHVNRSTISLSSGDAAANLLTLARPDGGFSQMSQTGGTLKVETVLDINDGVYRLSGGKLEAGALQIGQLFVSINRFGPPDLEDVPWPEDSDPLAIVPPRSRFYLDGGELNVAGEVGLGPAQLRINGGQLQAGSMFIDGMATTYSEVEALQTAGDVALAGDLKIQDGTYQLAGGALTVDRLVMGDPSSQRWQLVTQSRTPAFHQTGGTMRVLSNLELCMPAIIGWDPVDTFTDITYTLEAGALNVAGDTVVGSLGLAPAQFIQTGGTHATAGTLRIEGAASEYAISGGTLEVHQLQVGTNVFNDGGRFSITSAAKVTVDSKITLGRQAEVQATAGSQIHLEGGSVEILGQDAQLLAGLENLSLLVTGDDDWSTLEAASLGAGASEAAFANNFRWGELIVGTDGEIGRLRLVDETNNLPYDQASSGNSVAAAVIPTAEQFGIEFANEAVYVDHLVVGAGSTLDLGGLTLYYREAQIDGEVLLSGGALVAAVPEPTAIALLGLAFAAFCIKRRRRG